jgi:hypothetical protein
LRIDQRPEIYVNRALVMLQLRRIDPAVNAFAAAARFNPGILTDIDDADLRARVAAAAALH